jgi:hypothetical protein
MGLLGKLFGGRKPKKQRIEDILGFFATLESRGVFIYQPLLFSFFFDDDNREKIESIIPDLKKLNLKIESIAEHGRASKFTLTAEISKSWTEKEFYELYDGIFTIGEHFQLKHYGDYEVGNVDKSKPIEVDEYFPGSNWGSSDLLDNGFPRINIMNTAFIDYKWGEKFPTAINVTFHYESDNEYNLPDEISMQKLDDIESELQRELQKKEIVYNIGRSTYNGRRTVLYYTRNKEVVKGIIENIVNKYNDQFSISFEFDHDTYWIHARKIFNYA